jgi:hypothetical protein
MSNDHLSGYNEGYNDGWKEAMRYNSIHTIYEEDEKSFSFYLFVIIFSILWSWLVFPLMIYRIISNYRSKGVKK